MNALLLYALKSFAVLSLAWLVAFALRQRSAATQHRVWTLGQVGLLVIPLVALAGPAWNWRIIPAHDELHHSNRSSGPPTRARLSSDQPIRSGPRPELQESTPPIAIEKPIATTSAPINWPRAVTLLWAAVALALITRFALRHVVLLRLLSRCRDCLATTAQSELHAAAARLGVTQPLRLLESNETISPLTAGTFRPVVVLPADAQHWPAEKTSAVLLHELAHIKRCDVLTQLLASVACALNWFNPLAWFGLAQMRRLRELACDDLVLTSGQRASDYAAVLLEVARRYRHPQFAGAVNMARQANVDHRITAILDAARNRVPLSRRAARGLAVAMVAVVAGVGTMRVESRAEETVQGSESSFPGPLTDADELVKQARQATFGADGLDRFLIRQTAYSSEDSRFNDGTAPLRDILWQVRQTALKKETEPKSQTDYELAWSEKSVLHSTKAETRNPPHRWEQTHYFSGDESWIKETSSTDGAITFYRYPRALAFERAIMPFAFPQLEAAGSRIPWSGPTVRLEEFSVEPQLTRYRLVGQEQVDGVDCDVYEGPARSERLWVERSTKLVKAMSRLYGQEELPNYLSELIVEVAGRSFKNSDEYRQWREQQPPELQAKLSAHWAAAHWPVDRMGHLSVFSAYKPVASGVQWPMVCDRTVVHPNGEKKSEGFKVYHSRIMITQATQDFSMPDLAKEISPQEGDTVVDRREKPEVKFQWAKANNDDEVAKRRAVLISELRVESAETDRINNTPINSIADAIEILTEGPKSEPTKVWARAIKYLVDHQEEALPALVAKLDSETRDHPISKLAFALRAIGDRRAVPALIRALPRTLQTSRSDYGLLIDDAELGPFMQQHDQSGKIRGKGGWSNGWMFSYGRAFREVISALRRLTGQEFNEMELNWVNRSEDAAQRRLQEAQFHKVATTWANWWEANWKTQTDDAAFAKVDLAALQRALIESPSRRELPVGSGVKRVGIAGGKIIQSAHESAQECFVDLDTEREAGWPKSLPPLAEIGTDSAQLTEWARTEGFDVVAITHTPPGEEKPLFCLLPLGMKVWKITADEHRALEESMIGKRPYPLSRPVELMIPQREVKKPYDYNYGGDAFLFLTAEGTAGVMRMTAQVTEPISSPGAYSSPDDQFENTGFHAGAKVSLSVLIEPEPK